LNILLTSVWLIFALTFSAVWLLTVTNRRNLPFRWTDFYLNLLNPNRG